MDKGRNSGIEGVVDIAGTPQFGMRTLFWSESTKVGTVNNTGQGDSDIGSMLNLIENGSVLLRGKVRKDLVPFPAALKNAQGTVTFYLSKGIAGGGEADVKMSATYAFTQVDFKYDEKTETLWDMTLGGPRLSALTPSGFASNATTSTLASNGTGNKYLYDGRQVVYDPQGLINSNEQTFNVWGLSADTDAAEITAIGAILSTYSAAPQTGVKVHSAIGTRLSSGVMRIRVHRAMRNSADDILFPETNSVRSFTDAFTDKAPFLMNDTRDVAILSNLIANASQGAAFLKSLLVKPITPGTRLVVFNYENPGATWKGAVRSGARQVMARMSGGVPQLWVDDVIAYTNTRCLIILRPLNDYTVVIRDFIMFRVITSTVIPEANPSTINGQTLPYVGQINSDIFEGLPIGTCVYQGARFKVKVDQLSNGNLTMLMGYSFHHNGNGIINGVPAAYISRGYIRSFVGGLPSAQSWVNASTLHFPGVVQPSAASFAAFTA